MNVKTILSLKLLDTPPWALGVLAGVVARALFVALGRFAYEEWLEPASCGRALAFA
jgi:hypothetical protein